MSSRKPVPSVDVAPIAPSPVDVMVRPGPTTLNIALDELTLDANVRRTPNVHKSLIESIKQHGVLVPILVKESLLGGYEVIDGQRRTIAAREAGRADIPAFIVRTVNSDADRIVSQVVINDHREEVSAWETAQAFQQLHLAGLTPAAIAKATSKPREEVKAGIDLAQSQDNVELFKASPELDLVSAAQIAELNAEPYVVSRLVQAAGTAQFDHEIARVKQETANREARDAMTNEFIASGYEILDYETARRASVAALSMLSNEQGGAAIEPTEHATCPGRAVHIVGQTVDNLRAVHYCAAWKTSGHFNRHAQNTAGATAGPQSEEDKAARRHTIEMNKNAEAALEVHEKWLSEFFARPLKSLPDGLSVAASRIFEGLSAAGINDFWVSDVRRWKADNPTSTKAGERYFFALACATVQRKYKREYWRETWQQHYVVPFLREIAALGYGLADFEAELVQAADDEAADA